MTAREEILQRIRAANQGNAATEEATSAWETLPRRYLQSGRKDPAEVLDLFEDRLRDYDALVHRCNVTDVAATVEQALRRRDSQPVLVPDGLPSEWLPAGFAFVIDENFTAPELDRFDGVLTAATLAIAETGTVVLQHLPGQGRRAVSLVPDYHLCVVRARDVVETVPEAIGRLGPSAALGTTFISGPSATADIEMTRIKGVHGPRTLEVILVL